MPMTNAGAVFSAAMAIGDGSVTNLAAGNAYLSVGDSATAFSAAQTDLVAATNKLRKLCTSVTRGAGTGVLTFVTTYSTSEANWAWEEVGVFNAASAGTMVARKVQSLGTKTSASSWQLTYTTTVSA